MATSSYVGIDVSKDRLDVAVLGDERGWQVENSREGIAKLVQQMQEVCPELIVVEATGGTSGLWWRPCFMLGSVCGGEPCAGETICESLWMAC